MPAQAKPSQAKPSQAKPEGFWGRFKGNLKAGTTIPTKGSSGNLTSYLANKTVSVMMLPVRGANDLLKRIPLGTRRDRLNESFSDTQLSDLPVNLLDFPRFFAIRAFRGAAAIAAAGLSIALVPVSELLINPIVSAVTALQGMKLDTFYKENTSGLRELIPSKYTRASKEIIDEMVQQFKGFDLETERLEEEAYKQKGWTVEGVEPEPKKPRHMRLDITRIDKLIGSDHLNIKSVNTIISMADKIAQQNNAALQIVRTSRHGLEHEQDVTEMYSNIITKPYESAEAPSFSKPISSKDDSDNLSTVSLALFEGGSENMPHQSLGHQQPILSSNSIKLIAKEDMVIAHNQQNRAQVVKKGSPYDPLEPRDYIMQSTTNKPTQTPSELVSPRDRLSMWELSNALSSNQLPPFNHEVVAVNGRDVEYKITNEIYNTDMKNEPDGLTNRLWTAIDGDVFDADLTSEEIEKMHQYSWSFPMKETKTAQILHDIVEKYCAEKAAEKSELSETIKALREQKNGVHNSKTKTDSIYCSLNTNKLLVNEIVFSGTSTSTETKKLKETLQELGITYHEDSFQNDGPYRPGKTIPIYNRIYIKPQDFKKYAEQLQNENKEATRHTRPQ